jgi:hypothetical protein
VTCSSVFAVLNMYPDAICMTAPDKDPTYVVNSCDPVCIHSVSGSSSLATTNPSV